MPYADSAFMFCKVPRAAVSKSSTSYSVLYAQHFMFRIAVRAVLAVHCATCFVQQHWQHWLPSMYLYLYGILPQASSGCAHSCCNTPHITFRAYAGCAHSCCNTPHFTFRAYAGTICSRAGVDHLFTTPPPLHPIPSVPFRTAIDVSAQVMGQIERVLNAYEVPICTVPHHPALVALAQ